MPFRMLGVDDNADELTLRRAYARLLKQNRPDDDPVAFQRLHEAYQECLGRVRQRQWAREKATDQADDEHLDDVPAPSAANPGPAGIAGSLDEDATTSAAALAARDPDDTQAAVDVLPPIETAGGDETWFDLGAFLQELFERIDRRDAPALLAWLNAHPELYSIRLKSAITADVLTAVTEREPPVPVTSLDVIAGFFAAESLGPQDWWLVEQIDAHRTAARTRDQFRSGLLPRSATGEQPRYFDELIDREISQKQWRWRCLALFLLPGLPTRIHNRILELDQLTDGAASDLANPRLKRLAGRLADRETVSPWRLGLTWIRVVVFTTLALGLFYLSSRRLVFELIEFGLICGALFTGWQIGLAGYLWLKRAIERRGHGHVFREGSALVLAAAALGIDAFSTAVPRSVAYLLVVVAISRAVTAMRFYAGYVLALMFGASDWLMASQEVYTTGFSPMLLGLAFATLFVVVLDRVQAARRGQSVDQIVNGESWLRRGEFVPVLGILAALVIAVAIMSR